MKKELQVTLVFMSLVIGLLVGYNFYQQEKNREQQEKNRDVYLECLRIAEALLKANPNRIATLYCSKI